MKALIIGSLLAVATFSVSAEWVNGYTKRDGTYVQGHSRAEGNAYRYDNPSSQTMGGSHRDEFSARPQYNLSNPSYNGSLDRNRNGTYDMYERR